MKSFRNPKYLERYEDVVFDLEQALATPANNAHQTKTGHRFVADNTGMFSNSFHQAVSSLSTVMLVKRDKENTIVFLTKE